MYNFIGMEYLAALALKKLNKQEILFSELDSYGIKVNKAFQEEKIDAVFLFSNKYALDLLRNYSGCFQLLENEIKIKRLVSDEELISKFISYLSTDVLSAIQKVKYAEVD